MTSDVRVPLQSRLAGINRRVRSIPQDVWLGRDIEDRGVPIYAELMACSNLVVENVKATSEREEVLHSIHYLGNLLMSWLEGVAQRAVGLQDLLVWRKLWGSTYSVVDERLGSIVQHLASQPLPVGLGEGASDDEAPAESPSPSRPRSAPSRQRVLFSSGGESVPKTSLMRDFKLEGAEGTLKKWVKSRKAIPIARSSQDPLTVALKLSILPVFNRVVSADDLQRLGFSVDMIGLYPILHDQILFGVNLHYCRHNDWSHSRIENHIQKQIAALSDHYGVKIVEATDYRTSILNNGYSFVWVMPESALALLQMRKNIFPVRWGLE